MMAGVDAPAGGWKVVIVNVDLPIFLDLFITFYGGEADLQV